MGQFVLIKNKKMPLSNTAVINVTYYNCPHCEEHKGVTKQECLDGISVDGAHPDFGSRYLFLHGSVKPVKVLLRVMALFRVFVKKRAVSVWGLVVYNQLKDLGKEAGFMRTWASMKVQRERRTLENLQMVYSTLHL